jgi:membrane protein YdbS with pleckstrin-like domain
MKIPILGTEIDERFLTHRRRSTSIAGMVCAVAAILLFEYRYFVNHRSNWDLLAVGVTFVAVKLALMVWYYLTD